MTASSRALLREAVHKHAPFRLTGLSERLFTAWFGGFFYNQIWEDPRVDLEALQLTPESRMLTISSAGCNVLNYLTAPPAAITAVDLNRYHVYLTRLKLAALTGLPTYEDFFQFFGCANLKRNRENYFAHVRERLDEETRRFWEGGGWVRRKVLGSRINYFTKNFYDYARLGFFLRFCHGVAKVTKRDPRAVLQARSTEDQARFFEQTIDPFFEHWLVKAIGKVPFLLFGIGIPPRQLQALREETDGRILDLYRERLRRLTCDYPVEDNYFTWQAFSRSYDQVDRRAVPDYLKEENYETIKAAAPRVQTHITSLHAYLGEQPDGSLDRFVFLDSQDWMPQETIHRLWEEIARVGRPGTRIIFRTASSRSPIEEALPRDLRARFDYRAETSRALFEQDRSAIYGGFHLYVMD